LQTLLSPETPIATGALVIDARPWSEIVSIRDAAGKEWLPAAGETTPFHLQLPVGAYDISLKGPDSRIAALKAEIPAAGLRSVSFEFQHVDVDAYLKAAGLPRRPGPPAELRKAVTEFFEGDYANAAETLRNARFSDARAEAQTRLIRGAARYSLYMAEGEKNPALRAQALQDLAAFYDANPSGTIPFASSFSPRLLKVLTDIRKQ
jgi:hypothetical protein